MYKRQALLRLTSENDTIVKPSRFIPILETTGLIYDVGYWVLKQTVITHQGLIMKGFLPIRFSVNVSGVQFKKHDFVDGVSRIIAVSYTHLSPFGIFGPKQYKMMQTEFGLSLIHI